MFHHLDVDLARVIHQERVADAEQWRSRRPSRKVHPAVSADSVRD